MDFNHLKDTVQWRLHLNASPRRVYDLLSTDSGRAKFWAETAASDGKNIHWTFPNGFTTVTKILTENPPISYEVEYIGGSRVRFDLSEDGDGGTDLLMTDRGIDPAYIIEVTAGWVSVLMALKAAADYTVDLRNHDPFRTWDQGYVEN